MGRSLPNYDIYLDKLKLYIEACELTLEYRDVDSDGIYIPSRRVIKIDRDLPESTEIATILHELSHAFDDSLHDTTKGNRLDKAYTNFYKDKANEKQVQLVIECEKRAWDYAKGIAKKLRIPLGKWFYQEESDALKSYRENGEMFNAHAEKSRT